MIADRDTFVSFQEANSTRKVGQLDYVGYIYKSRALPGDFLIAMSTLFKPKFCERDGHLFVSDLFDEERLSDFLRKGLTVTVAQYWMNLLEISGLFDGLTTEQATKLANDIKDCWNLEIERHFANLSGRASVVYEEELREVFVSIGTAPVQAL